MSVVYVSVGNSDDKLTQREWAMYVDAVDHDLRFWGLVHGQWFSEPSSQWQNACWCVEWVNQRNQNNTKALLSATASRFLQDSIAWAEITETEFIKPTPVKKASPDDLDDRGPDKTGV